MEVLLSSLLEQLLSCYVATRSQHLGPGGPEERLWMVYTASVDQPAPESVHCGAMENTCGGGRRRAGNILKAVPCFPSRESSKYVGTLVFL